MGKNLFISNSNLKKVFISLVFVIIFLFIAAGISFYFKIKLKKLFQTENFTINKNTRNLITGDSHTKSSLIDSLVKNSINISVAEESYFFTYYKLIPIIKANPQIDKVILGFSYHNITIMYDNYIYDSDKFLEGYFPLIDNYGKKFMKKDFHKYFIYYLQYNIGFPINFMDSKILHLALKKNQKHLQDFPFCGKYYKSIKTNLDSVLIQERVDYHFYTEDKSYIGFSKIMHEYIEKIANLCEKNDIELYLITTPLHPQYLSGIPKQAIKDFDDLKSTLSLNYSNIVFLDFSNMQLPDTMYGDCNHLNYYGAIKFSKIIDSIVNPK